MSDQFTAALLAAERPVIMELKARAADGRDLFGGRAVAELVRRYEGVGAPCLSVVTGRWFGGTAELLGDVVARTSLPVLHKDFFTNPRQLRSARDGGAAAVLLTAGLLPGAALPTLVEASVRLGLTPFVEVTTREEIDAIGPCDRCIVAVNNKDIRTRERGAADVDRSLRLLPDVRRAGSPAPVSASGIEHPAVAARLLAAGYAGLLVGTGLLRTERLEEWFDELDECRRAAGAAIPVASGPVR